MLGKQCQTGDQASSYEQNHKHSTTQKKKNTGGQTWGAHMPSVADTMTQSWHGVGARMEKLSHAVSTCSPDCPTESAVERALVDLEWRREAAGKRNGNTHRVNTQVPEETQGCHHRGRFSWRNGAGDEWTAGLAPTPCGSHWPHTPLTHTGMTEALVTVLHTKDALTDSDSRFRFTPRSFYQPVWK